MVILYSNTSSRGNCSVIESGNGHLLIIDAGIPYKKVDKEIGYKLHKADGLLITHSHKDHTSHISEFYQSNIPLYISDKTMKDMCICFLGEEIRYLFQNKKFETNGFLFISLEMVHTNSNGFHCECYGFLILDKSTGEKMLWATDTQYIKNKFGPLEYYCLESNFFEKQDYTGELNYIEKTVEQRRVQSHMSFESVVKFLKQQDLSKCKEIRLLHLSSSLSDKDKKKMKRKLRSEIKTQISGKEVKIYE